MDIDRRAVIGASAALPAAVSAGVAGGAIRPRFLPPQRAWDLRPGQAPETARLVEIADGTRLWTRDTGGPGEPVILLHPATGSAEIWRYQQPALAARGYRVIAYSRRGHFGTEHAAGDPGSAAGDLEGLVRALGIRRFHLVGLAAGGFVIPDYACAYPRRLLSITLACTQFGIQEPGYLQRIAAITPPEFAALPASLRELGPSFRFANPTGTAAWEALERSAVPNKRIVQPTVRRIGWSELESIPVPALVIAGDADLYAPVPLMLEAASHLRRVDVAILGECGHSAYWEQPLAFNSVLVDFLRRHRAR